MKTVIYCRVSTEMQALEPQLAELRGYCAGRKWEIVAEKTDVMSGGKRAGRVGLEEVMTMVKAREIEALVVVKIDRLARSLVDFMEIVTELDRNSVALVVTSQGIDTSKDNPAGRLQMHVLSAVAEFERSLISERVKAGMAVVKASGKQLGHPSKVLPANCEWVVRSWHARTGGVGLRELRKLLGGCSLSTAAILAKRHAPKPVA